MRRYVKKLINRYGLCAWCIGRQLTKDPDKFYELGKRIFEELGLRVKDTCWLCDGFFHKDFLIKKIWEELSKFEFESIDFGIVVDAKKVEFEDEMRARLKTTGGLVLKKAALAFMRHKFSTMYGTKIEAGEPDAKVLLHMERSDFTILTKPVILELRFLKYDRGGRIRAGECKACKGRGCNFCKGSGKANDGSLESFLLFDLPKLLGGDSVKIKWSVKDFERSLISGLGRPLYLILKNVKKLKTAPLLIPYRPLDGFQITLSRKVTKKMIKESFIQTTSVKIEVSRTLVGEELEFLNKFFRNRDVLIMDKNGKTGKKTIYFLNVKPLDDRISHILIKHDTGLNLEKFICGKGSGSQIEVTLADLIKDVKIKIKEIDVLNVEEKDN